MINTYKKHNIKTDLVSISGSTGYYIYTGPINVIAKHKYCTVQDMHNKNIYTISYQILQEQEQSSYNKEITKKCCLQLVDLFNRGCAHGKLHQKPCQKRLITIHSYITYQPNQLTICYYISHHIQTSLRLPKNSGALHFLVVR